MADNNEVIAAILSSVLTAHQRTSAADLAAVVDTYHACLVALRHHGDVPAGERWSAAAEARRLADDGRKP